MIYLISPIAAQDEDGQADIYCSVWHAVGDDFQWFYPMVKNTRYTDGSDSWSAGTPNVTLSASNLANAPLWYTPAVSQSIVQDFKDSFMLPDKVVSVGACDNTCESSVTFRDVIFRPRRVLNNGVPQVMYPDPYKSQGDPNFPYMELVPRLMRAFRFW